MHLTTSGSSSIAIFWIGFFVLEGFDFGVGMLQPFVGRKDDERRVAHQHHRPDLGRQRGVADRGRGRDLRRLPGLVRHHVLVLLPGPGGRAGGAHRRGGSRSSTGARSTTPVARTWRWSHGGRQRARPAAARGRPGRPAARPADRQGGQLHGQLLRPPRALRPVQRRHPALLSLLLGATISRSRRPVRSATGPTGGRGRSRASPCSRFFGLLTWTHVGLGKGFFPNPLEVLAMLAVIAAALVAGAAGGGLGVHRRRRRHRRHGGPIFAELFPTSWCRAPTTPTA